MLKEELDELCTRNVSSVLLEDIKENILEIGNKNEEILLIEEETWRQKCREVWLSYGDQIIKFFHRYENKRRRVNTNWEISKENGSTILV